MLLPWHCQGIKLVFAINGKRKWQHVLTSYRQLVTTANTWIGCLFNTSRDVVASQTSRAFMTILAANIVVLSLRTAENALTIQVTHAHWPACKAVWRCLGNWLHFLAKSNKKGVRKALRAQTIPRGYPKWKGYCRTGNFRDRTFSRIWTIANFEKVEVLILCAGNFREENIFTLPNFC